MNGHGPDPLDASTSTDSLPVITDESDKKPAKKRRRNSDPADKPHVCDWEGCGKRYSRIDHLSRHRLNHEASTVYTCDRCDKKFVRSDLLIRHVERHEKREANESEAARTGQRLTQSQRLQQSAGSSLSGVTVTSLPQPAPPTTVPTSLQQPVPQAHQNGQTTEQLGFPAFRQPALPHVKPAHTASSTSSHDTNQSPQYPNQSPHFAQPVAPTQGAGGPWGDPTNAMQQAYWNLANPPQVSPFVLANTSQAPIQGFSPLSAISTFSPHSYSSPHGSNQSPQDQQEGTASGNLVVPRDPAKSPFSNANTVGPGTAGRPPLPASASGSNSMTAASSSSGASIPNIVTAGAPDATQSFDPSLFNFEDSFQFVQASYGAPFVSASEYDWLFDASKDFNFQLGTSRPVSPRGTAPSASAQTAMTPRTTKEFEDALRHFSASAVTPITKDLAPTQESFVDYRDGPTMPPRGASEATALDKSVHFHNETRVRVINYLGPQWHYLLEDYRMSCDKLQEYLELFFSRVYDTQSPVVHRPTFDTRTAPTPLLLSMALLGCYFSTPESHNLSAQIHPHFRSLVISSADFKPRAELWVHQTVLLIIMYGKLCSNRPAHEMAHIFWSSVVTLGRRSALYSQRPPTVVAKPDDASSLWAAWIEEETAKRVAHVGFAIDVEHAALFRHSPTLSAFQIQLTLPCDEEEWEAATADEWLRVHARSKPPIPFISALKASLMPGHSPPSLNPFSRITILHGLMSVAQDLQWRDHVIGLSAPDGRAQNWRDMISAAYNAWKSRLDQCLVDASFPTSQLLRASISLYAVAHVTLSIDIHELQIFAGAESALGLLVSKQVYEGTVARVSSWSQTKDGRMSAWHSAHFIRSSLQHHFHSTTDLAGCLVHRWVVYMSTLCVFCYVVGTTGKAGARRPNHREATMKYLDRLCTPSPDELPLVSDKHDCLCLLETIYDYIKDSRWVVAKEGAVILKNLIMNGGKVTKAI